MKKTALTKEKWDEVLNRFDNLIIPVDRTNGDKLERILDTRILFSSIIEVIMGFHKTYKKKGKHEGIVPIEYTDEEKVIIKNFDIDFREAIKHFIDLLDCDGDGYPELVIIDGNGNIKDVGEDIKVFNNHVKEKISILKNDVKEIEDSYKNNPIAGIFMILSKLLVYIENLMVIDDDDLINETYNDFKNFYDSCKKVYSHYDKITKIDHLKFIKEKSEDIMNIVMITCLIILPIIDLAKQKINLFKNLSNEDFAALSDKDLMISRSDVNIAIELYYGTSDLTIMLQMIDAIIKSMMKRLKSKKIREKLKKMFSCCYSSIETE